MAKIPKNKQIKTLIYTLSDPVTGEVRYIGKTIKPLKTRLTGHIYTSKKKNNYRCNWIKSITNKGMKPVIKLLDYCEWNQSQELEEYWISQFKTWGYRLVNSTDGGEGNLGFRLTKERRDKLILSVSKKVYQYDLQGNFIKEYSSCLEAARNIGFKSSSKIGLTAKGIRGKAAGFLWSYEKLENLIPYKRKTRIISNTHKKILRKSKSIPIVQYDKNGVFIKQWDSAKIAASFLKFNYVNLVKAINKTTPYKNFIWKKL